MTEDEQSEIALLRGKVKILEHCVGRLLVELQKAVPTHEDELDAIHSRLKIGDI